MPQLGESVTEGTLAHWLKKPGEPVAKYESIAEVASDKVNAEIPAPADGTFGEILAAEGTVVTVGQPICTIEQPAGAEVPAAAPAAAAPSSAAQPVPAAQPLPAPQAQAPAAAPPLTPAVPAAPVPSAWTDVQPGAAPAAGEPASAPGSNGGSADAAHYHLTPAVRMLVREHDVDLSGVQGTGIGGRITKKDVLAYVQARGASIGGSAPAPAAPAPAWQPAGAPVEGRPAAAPAPAVATEGGDTLEPMTSIRRAIADHMVRSRQTSPHAWLTVEVDMSAVSRLRDARKAEFRQRFGASLTYLPFVARALCEALQRRPTLNAQWTEQGILLKRDINLGIAVALEENLIVPVIRHADRLSITGLAQTMADLGQRARTNRLTTDEIQGGTFTLNNTGALGTVLTQAIINQPQAAILTMDAVIRRPVVVGDMIAIRPIMNLGLSFDHRLNDGLQAARFVKDIKEMLEGIDEGAALI
jgi:pyruvate/2-oxoglutarate dehydrogenase complex dihydrolipoamide acyltransferase (E2) component